MEADERLQLLDALASSRTELIEAIDGLSRERWNFRGAPDRWSIAQCVEHIILVENRILKSVQKTVTQPAQSGTAPRPDSDIVNFVPDRSKRFQAPEPMAPKGAWADPAGAMSEFEDTRARSMRFVSETQDDLRGHSFKHMALGDLDCFQWLLLIPGHCRRHIAQIREAQSSSAYPAG